MRGLPVLLALGALAACHDGGAAAAHAAAGAPAAAAPAAPASPKAAADYYTAELQPGPARCVHGAPCRAVIRLAALGKYHVNEEYPFRFVPDAAPGTTFAADKALTHDDAQLGTLEVEFTPSAAGTLHLAGVFKLSVCSESACQIERPRLALDVPVE